MDSKGRGLFAFVARSLLRVKFAMAGQVVCKIFSIVLKKRQSIAPCAQKAGRGEELLWHTFRVKYTRAVDTGNWSYHEKELSIRKSLKRREGVP